MQIIAEVKTKSPFGYVSKLSWEEQFALANKIGDIISIHTDKRWGGSYDLLEKARDLTNKPILAKGLHKTNEEIERCLDIGADYVLAVRDYVDFFCDDNYATVMIEPTSLEFLTKLTDERRDFHKIVWNQRDLTTGLPKKETFEDARKIYKGYMVQASMIKTRADINPTANAVLVGEYSGNFVE